VSKAHPPALSGIVLAAGEGRRFDPSGLRWKLEEPLPDGRPIARAACEAMLAWVDELVVVGGTRERELVQMLAGLPLRIVHCDDAQAGMGASLKCGIRATRPSLGWLLALADMPFIASSSFQRVSGALRSGATAARPFFEGRPGHPVAFAASLRERLLGLDDEDGAAPLIRDLGKRLVRLEGADLGCIRDIDRPCDLEPAQPTRRS
jgi:molybdenum cofactor cytidylyltransferase